MSLLETLGFETQKKIRYAIVGLGDISQESMMPGVKHTGNSEIAALVTGDPEKARQLTQLYQPAVSYSYEEFGKLVGSGTIDAIYLATPNWRHAEFAVPALQAGIHVLLEKPMEISVARCEEILAAQRHSNAKLMIAYRLHFEPATLSALSVVRSGKLGHIRAFSSLFAQNVRPDNHRATSGVEAGPIFDMGPYPINAVRNIFGTEPVEVSAVGVRHNGSDMGDFDDTVSVTMKFPQDRLAQFTVSYVGNSIDTYTVLGTEGSLEVSPGFTFGKSLEYKLTLGTDKKNESFKNTDHFGGEMKYFSDCILKDKDPEPDGEEGLLDVRVIEAIVKSLATGSKQVLAPKERSKHIDVEQVQKLGPVSPPKEVNAASPSS